MSTDNSTSYNQNAFSGNAGPEEIQHVHDLLNELTDGQLKMLVENCGLDFTPSDGQLEREEYMKIIGNADREDFYREYREIVKNNVCLMTEE